MAVEQESIGVMMGLIVSVIIIASLSFISCTTLKQDADIRTKVAYDHFASYLQQCQTLQQKSCACSPPLRIDPFASGQNIILKRYSDGLYLDLQLQSGKLLQHKKVSTKDLCKYNYSFSKSTWSEQSLPSYTFTTGAGAESHSFYIDEHQNICYYIPEAGQPALPPCLATQPSQTKEPSPQGIY